MSASPPPAIMVLGPSDWLPQGATASALKPEMTPLEARRHIATILRAWEVPVVLMEEHEAGEGTTNHSLFTKLIEEYNVKTFLVVWPLGTKTHGLNVEFGFLLSCFSGDKLSPDSVFLLIEEAVVEMEEDGGEVVLSINEKGNRTHYYSDLSDAGCPMLLWDNVHSLRLAVLNVALDHSKRHGLEIPDIGVPPPAKHRRGPEPKTMRTPSRRRRGD
jgi:hypothetical protein